MSDDTGQRLDVVRQALATLQPLVQAGDPWPLAVSFGTEPEADWGPREVLAHVAEMLSFWRGEVERIVDGTGAPVPFGRVAEDAVRIGLIERDRSLPLRVLFDRIDRELAAWTERLASLAGPQQDRSGIHARFGQMTAAALADRFVIGHTAEHVAQLDAIVAARPA